jgi:hypothetical protein
MPAGFYAWTGGQLGTRTNPSAFVVTVDANTEMFVTGGNDKNLEKAFVINNGRAFWEGTGNIVARDDSIFFTGLGSPVRGPEWRRHVRWADDFDKHLPAGGGRALH